MLIVVSLINGMFLKRLDFALNLVLGRFGLGRENQIASFTFEDFTFGP
jgi:hypothetical protein